MYCLDLNTFVIKLGGGGNKDKHKFHNSGTFWGTGRQRSDMGKGHIDRCNIIGNILQLGGRLGTVLFVFQIIDVTCILIHTSNVNKKDGIEA